MSDNCIFLTMPRAGKEARCFDATRHFWHPGKTPHVHMPHATSSLPMTFNQAWQLAVDGRRGSNLGDNIPPDLQAFCNRHAQVIAPRAGYTHFAMQHDDIVPLVEDWLDRLIEEMDRVGADVISAISPIKDQRGLTSCGIDTPGNPWAINRFTLHQLWERDETFTDPLLSVNVGLFVVKLGDWCRDVWFQQIHRMMPMPNGTMVPTMISEDWDASRQMRKLGKRLFVTRKVPLYHEQKQWHTSSPWGTWAIDEDFDQYLQTVRRSQMNGEPMPEPMELVIEPADAVAGAA